LSAHVSARGREGPAARFFERLGIYLLVGPAVASLAILLPNVLLSGLPRDALAWQTAGLFLLMLYLIALPVAGLYAAFVAVTLAIAKRVALHHVALCSILVSLILYFPALVLAQPSDPMVFDSSRYLRIFAFVFVPVFAAGFVCWKIAPSLHRVPE
jgi:hypothetical protein